MKGHDAVNPNGPIMPTCLLETDRTALAVIAKLWKRKLPDHDQRGPERVHDLLKATVGHGGPMSSVWCNGWFEGVRREIYAP